MWREWFARAKLEPTRPVLSFDSFIAAQAAAIAGAGVLLGSRPLIDPALAAREVSSASPPSNLKAPMVTSLPRARTQSLATAASTGIGVVSRAVC